jgi:hypothetical protein
MHDLLWLLILVVVVIAIFGGATALALDLVWKLLIVLVVVVIIGAIWNAMRGGRRTYL